MIYKDFKNKKLSALGMGTMRFPVVDGNFSEIDIEATEKMIDYAIAHGVNYFDTAWGYHGGQSEIVTGNALKKYPRESFYLADKFPGYDLSNMDKVKEIFEEQLKKCSEEYFDFYLFHNVCEMNIDAYLDRSYGIFDYLLEQKQNGRIKHLGFSVHGSYEVTKRFLEEYGDAMEFCQIQLNYLDWDFQKAKDKVELLNEYGIPVWVMEPLRGGKLAVLSDEYVSKLKSARPDESVVGWAFRFLQTVESVKVTLSGMSDFEQLRENIEIFETEKPLSDAELKVLKNVADDMVGRIALPCTSCRYCTDHCPMGLDIPDLIYLYNEYCFTGGGFIPSMKVSSLPENKRPSACIGCRSCEAVCPQQIKISEALADFTKKLK
ncbi:MAG: oxidoreductase [Ruminococcaceae bacterium]|nr:oxidoreductase [Oscillospiraceae bacterium]